MAPLCLLHLRPLSPTSGPSGDDDDDADDDDGYRLSCGGAGVCMEAVAGFPQRCMVRRRASGVWYGYLTTHTTHLLCDAVWNAVWQCDRNLAPPACGNPLSQPGASKQERWCAWAEGALDCS